MANESFWKHLVLGLRLTYGGPLRRRLSAEVGPHFLWEA